MKKILIAIFPLYVISFVLTLISFGLKGALTFLGAVLFVVALAFGFVNQRKAIKIATQLAREKEQKVGSGNEFTTNELIKFFMLGVEWNDNKIYATTE